MATAFSGSLSALPTVQAAMHCFSWGQTLPQIAGSMELSRMTSRASSNRPSPASFKKTGMSIATGQPPMQGAVLHWRQREASTITWSSV